MTCFNFQHLVDNFNFIGCTGSNCKWGSKEGATPSLISCDCVLLISLQFARPPVTEELPFSFANYHVPCADFHVGCIDQWLLTRRPFCPICKQDANALPTQPAATETTPLLEAPAGRAVSVPITSSAATQTSPLVSPEILTTQSLPAHVSGEDLC